MRSSQLALVVAAACAVPAALAPAPAEAQDARAIKRVEDMNRAAMEDYDLLEFEAAKKQLNEALVLVKKHRLEKHPVAARTHLNLGTVYAGGLNDPDTAVLEFIAAIELDPSIKLDKAYRTPDINKLFEQARSTVGVPKGGGDKGGGRVTGLRHSPVDEAPANRSLKISAKVGADVKARKVVLLYRAAGDDDWSSRPMKKLGANDYAADIPKSATSGETVHYYIEARNAAGKVVASNGSASSPNLVSLTASSGVGAIEDETNLDEEDPLAGGRGGGGGDDDDDGDPGVSASMRGERHSVFLSVSVGSSAAFVTGTTEVAKQPVSAGLAPELVHLQPEIGFWLGPRTTLSVVGRIGFPLGANVTGAAFLAPAGLLRYTFVTKGNAGLSFHGDLGGGFIRQTIKLSGSPGGIMGDTDTHAIGPLLVGGGVGWVKPLGSTLRFVVDSNLLFGVPVVEQVGNATPSFGVALDVHLGMAFAF